MPNREPLYPHIPKREEPLFPHVPKGQSKESYTPPELADIARIFYDTNSAKRAWEDLSQAQRDEAIEGLRVRIEREGLLGYLERKRPAAGDELTNSIITQLRAKGYLSSGSAPSQNDYIEAPFSGAGAGELQWEKVLGERIITITVTNIIGVPQYDLEIDFRDSVARISNLMAGYTLPFAGTAKGKLWWFATINDVPVEVEVSGIRLLTQIQLEDAFANSIARIEEVSAQTEGNPVRYCCRRCGDCAPEELLEEGKFPERISWLRRHYQEKHPGIWGKG